VTEYAPAEKKVLKVSKAKTKKDQSEKKKKKTANAPAEEEPLSWGEEDPEERRERQRQKNGRPRWEEQRRKRQQAEANRGMLQREFAAQDALASPLKKMKTANAPAEEEPGQAAQEPGHAAQDAPQETANAPGAGRARGANTGQHKVPYGCCWLTPRFKKHTDITIAWQMTCTCDSHNLLSKCTKEYSVAKAGSEDICVRRLKTWILRSIARRCVNRDSHRLLFDDEIALLEGSDLPSMQELDNAAPGSCAMPKSLCHHQLLQQEHQEHPNPSGDV
jgi:hypothetical protein